MTHHRLFVGRTLVLSTMHGKEQVMAPLLEQSLGVNVLVPTGFNTDQFGTFSGEIEREGSPYDTALKKCKLACEVTGHTLAVASEGSFGPHPDLGFIPCDDELVLFYDATNDRAIGARELTTSTNFTGRQIDSVREAQQFAIAAGIPEHAVIVSNLSEGNSAIIKGINNLHALLAIVEKRLEKYGTVYLTTDMRAMHNPTRMRVIETATRKLIEKITSVCPVCTSPGYSITDYTTGLPCNICSSPTRSILSAVYTCSKCGHTYTQMYPKGKTSESPMYCDWCNP